MEDYIYDVYICYSQKDYFDVQGNVIPGNEITRILQALDEAFGLPMKLLLRAIWKKSLFLCV